MTSLHLWLIPTGTLQNQPYSKIYILPTEIKHLEIKESPFIILHQPIWVFLPYAIGTSLFLHLPFGRFVSVSSFFGFGVDILLLEAIQLVVFY